MNKDLKDKLESIKQKLETIENSLHKGLAWLLIILCSLVIAAFLEKLFEAISVGEPIGVKEWLGFLVSLGLLVVGILSVSHGRKKEQD